jgi:MFS family permease
MDLTRRENRGRFLGFYQIAFFAGAGGGAAFGGVLTDLLGYHLTMEINAWLTLLGALAALFFLPETRPADPPENQPMTGLPAAAEADGPSPEKPRRGELASATALMVANRLVQEGLLLATLALFIEGVLGETLQFNGLSIGSASLTGAGFGLTTLVGAISAPFSGAVSDRTANRWQIAGLCLLPGVAGFGLLQAGTPSGIVLGLIGASIAAGSSANLSTALIGDLGSREHHGRRLGGLLTAGDVASAAGPLLAFWLAPLIGLEGVYWLAAGIFGLMAAVALLWGRRRSAAG